MKCGLCHQDVPKLSRSHIIPRALMLYGRQKEDKAPLLLMPADQDKRVVRNQNGIYSEIVCPKCEASFQQGDEALIGLCRDHDNGVHPRLEDGSVAAGVWAYPRLENHALHRGFLTTLYRAHLSPHDLFKHVDVGDYHAERLRQTLLSTEPANLSDYQVVLRVVPTLDGSVIASPFREKWDGVNAYRFYFPHITAFIKVDRQPFKSEFRIGRLGALNHPHAIVADRVSPSEWRMLGKTMFGRDAEVARFAAKG
jgi:hypothetical protein